MNSDAKDIFEFTIVMLFTKKSHAVHTFELGERHEEVTEPTRHPSYPYWFLPLGPLEQELDDSPSLRAVGPLVRSVPDQ